MDSLTDKNIPRSVRMLPNISKISNIPVDHFKQPPDTFPRHALFTDKWMMVSSISIIIIFTNIIYRYFPLYLKTEHREYNDRMVILDASILVLVPFACTYNIVRFLSWLRSKCSKKYL